MSRFDGKPVMMIKDVKNIDEAKTLLYQAVNEEIDIFHYQNEVKKPVKAYRINFKTNVSAIKQGN